MCACVCVCVSVYGIFVFPPGSRIVFLEGCGSNHSTMYRAFFCIKKFTLSINVIILCTDLGSWLCFGGGDDIHVRANE